MRGIREMDIDFYCDYVNAVNEARGPAWRYDEMKPCGVNFNNFFLARLYDTYHQRFRDYRREAEQIIAALGLDNSATVIDMGCGTGAFALHAARHCRTIYAVDIAKAMLGRARRKARKAGLTNIEFRRGGFLTYQHADEPVDAIVSVVALHHLPDFWKLVALHRLASMLKPDGRLYLSDVVFSFDVGRCAPSVERFIEKMSVPHVAGQPQGSGNPRTRRIQHLWLDRGGPARTSRLPNRRRRLQRGLPGGILVHEEVRTGSSRKLDRHRPAGTLIPIVMEFKA